MSKDKKRRKRQGAIWAGLSQGLIGGLVAPIVVGLFLVVAGPLLQNRLIEPSCDAPRDLQLVKASGASASGFLQETAGTVTVTHEAGLAIDGNTSTAWVEGVMDTGNPYGVGEWVELTVPDATDVQMICVVNGYAKSDETFIQNARVRQWKVITDSGERFSVLPDKSVGQLTAYQSLDLKTGRTSKIRLTIETFRAPTGAVRYTDTALSEVEIWAR